MGKIKVFILEIMLLLILLAIAVTFGATMGEGFIIMTLALILQELSNIKDKLDKKKKNG